MRKDYVAIKIVRNIDKYRHAAMIEVGLPAPCARRVRGCMHAATDIHGAPWVRLHIEASAPSRRQRHPAWPHALPTLAVYPPFCAHVYCFPQLEVLNTLEKNDPEGVK